MTLNEVIQTFYYDITSKTSIRWNIDKFTGSHRRTHTVKRHSEAGGINTQGYGEVKYNSKSYKCHRIAYMLLNNCEIKDNDQIDHLDGNRLNNSYDNLKLSSAKQTARNKKVRENSVTGINGITFTSNGQGNYYTRAIWTELDGTDRWKIFSHLKYGKDEATKLAIEYRNMQINRLQTEGADYSERHIKGECYESK